MTGLIFLLALTSLSSSPLMLKGAQAPIEFLGFWRLIIAAFILGIFLLWREGSRFISNLDWNKTKWANLAGLFFFLHLTTYIFAAQNTSISHAVILFSTNPIFTSVGAIWFFKEKLRKRLFIVYPIAFIGVWLISQEKVSHHDNSHIGDISALITATLHAAYLLASKRARVTLPNMHFSFILYLTAGLFFGFLGLTHNPQIFSYSETRAWLAISGLIIFPTFLGHMLMTNLVSKIDLSLLSCGKLIEPGLSSAMAYFFFKENFTLQSGIAFSLTAIAILILFWPKKWIPRELQKP